MNAHLICTFWLNTFEQKTTSHILPTSRSADRTKKRSFRTTVVFRLDRQPDFKKSLRGVSVTVKTSPPAIEGVSRFAYRQKNVNFEVLENEFSLVVHVEVLSSWCRTSAGRCDQLQSRDQAGNPVDAGLTSRFKSRLFCLSSVFHAIQRNVIASTSSFLQTLKPPAPKNKDKDF